jgi:hypothetical protein
MTGSTPEAQYPAIVWDAAVLLDENDKLEQEALWLSLDVKLSGRTAQALTVPDWSPEKKLQAVGMARFVAFEEIEVDYGGLQSSEGRLVLDAVRRLKQPPEKTLVIQMLKSLSPQSRETGDSPDSPVFGVVPERKSPKTTISAGDYAGAAFRGDFDAIRGFLVASGNIEPNRPQPPETGIRFQ